MPAPSFDALARCIVERLPAMCAYWDADQRCRFANGAYETWFGVTPEQLVGRTLRDLLGPIYELNLPYVEGVLRGETQEFEREIPDPRGGPSRHSHAIYVPDVVDGKVQGFCVLVVDITQRRRAEEQLLEAQRRLAGLQRIAAMSTLAAGVGHEINNPLAVLLANLELLAEQPLATEMLADAREAAERIAQVVATMGLLAQGESGKPARVDVNAIVERAASLATHRAPTRARLHVERGEPCFVNANELQLTQALVNLIVNGADACATSEQDSGDVHVRAWQEGARAIVEVRDSGPGIGDDVSARIFDPFFTTRGVGQGMGLGLPVAHSIVQAHGGELVLESSQTAGSAFRIVLPVATTPSADEAPPASRIAMQRRAPRVLIVDDEEALCKALARALSNNALVTTTTSGRRGVELAASSDFDLVLCDVSMPDLGGPAVFAEVTARRPELAEAFVFMTGGTFTDEGRALLARGVKLLRKPFDLDELRSLVGTFPLLEERASGTGRAGSRRQA